MFVGNDKGQVLKIVNFVGGQPNNSSSRQAPVLVEELQVLKFGKPVLGLQLSSKAGSKEDGSHRRLLVIARDEILAVPVARCGVAASCSACVQLQDPYCGWNIVSSKCVSHNTFNSMYASEFLQNVSIGRHRQCGDQSSQSNVIIEEFKDGREVIESRPEPSEDLKPSILMEQQDHGRYSTEELSMAVGISCVSALLIGFIVGFLLARKCQCGSDNPYHVPYLNRSGYEEENIYAKVDDMTYYPVVGPIQTMASPADQVVLGKPQHIINNMLVTMPPVSHQHQQMEGDGSKTLNLHQANLQKQKDFNTFNAFSTVHRSQKIYL